MSGQGGGREGGGGVEGAGRGRWWVVAGPVKRRPPFKRSYFNSFSAPAWDFGVKVSTWLISFQWEDSAFRHRCSNGLGWCGKKKRGGWELQGAAERPSDVGQSAACWSLSSADSFPPAEDTVCHAGGVGAGTWSQRRCRRSVCKTHPPCVLPKLPEDVFWERLPVDCRGAFKFGKRNQINRWLC